MIEGTNVCEIPKFKRIGPTEVTIEVDDERSCIFANAERDASDEKRTKRDVLGKSEVQRQRIELTKKQNIVSNEADDFSSQQKERINYFVSKRRRSDVIIDISEQGNGTKYDDGVPQSRIETRRHKLVSGNKELNQRDAKGRQRKLSERLNSIEETVNSISEETSLPYEWIQLRAHKDGSVECVSQYKTNKRRPSHRKRLISEESNYSNPSLGQKDSVTRIEMKMEGFHCESVEAAESNDFEPPTASSLRFRELYSSRTGFTSSAGRGSRATPSKPDTVFRTSKAKLLDPLIMKGDSVAARLHNPSLEEHVCNRVEDYPRSYVVKDDCSNKRNVLPPILRQGTEDPNEDSLNKLTRSNSECGSECFLQTSKDAPSFHSNEIPNFDKQHVFASAAAGVVEYRFDDDVTGRILRELFDEASNDVLLESCAKEKELEMLDGPAAEISRTIPSPSSTLRDDGGDADTSSVSQQNNDELNGLETETFASLDTQSTAGSSREEYDVMTSLSSAQSEFSADERSCKQIPSDVGSITQDITPSTGHQPNVNSRGILGNTHENSAHTKQHDDVGESSPQFLRCDEMFAKTSSYTLFCEETSEALDSACRKAVRLSPGDVPSLSLCRPHTAIPPSCEHNSVPKSGRLRETSSAKTSSLLLRGNDVISVSANFSSMSNDLAPDHRSSSFCVQLPENRGLSHSAAVAARRAIEVGATDRSKHNSETNEASRSVEKQAEDRVVFACTVSSLEEIPTTTPPTNSRRSPELNCQYLTRHMNRSELTIDGESLDRSPAFTESSQKTDFVAKFYGFCSMCWQYNDDYSWYLWSGKGLGWRILMSPVLLLIGPFVWATNIFHLSPRLRACWKNCWRCDHDEFWFSCKGKGSGLVCLLLPLYVILGPLIIIFTLLTVVLLACCGGSDAEQPNVTQRPRAIRTF